MATLHPTLSFCLSALMHYVIVKWKYVGITAEMSSARDISHQESRSSEYFVSGKGLEA